MKTLLTLLTTLTIVSTSLGQIDPEYLDSIPVENAFKFKNEYRYVMPARQMFYGGVAGVQARSDSRMLAFIADPQANQKIPFFPGVQNLNSNSSDNPGIYTLDLTSGTSKLIYPLNQPDTQISSYSWLDATPYLTVTLSNTESNTDTVYLVNPTNNSRQAIYTSTAGEFVGDPLYDKATNTVTIFNERKTESQIFSQAVVISLSNNSKTVYSNVGVRPYFMQNDNGTIVETEWSQTSYKLEIIGEFNPVNGTKTPTARRTLLSNETPYFVNPNGPFIRITDSTTRESNLNITANSYATLTVKGTEGGSTIDGQFAWFVDRSGLHINAIRPLTSNQYLELVADIVRQETVSRAKQVGTGMMIYCADYDDQFPPHNDWQTNIHPYLKNSKITEGFNYLLNGENASDITDPANTVLGTIDTPFGQAIVRVDGSVIWKDRPKTTLLK